MEGSGLGAAVDVQRIGTSDGVVAAGEVEESPEIEADTNEDVQPSRPCQRPIYHRGR